MAVARILEGPDLEDWCLTASAPQTRKLAECVYAFLRHRITPQVGNGPVFSLGGITETLNRVHAELVDVGLVIEEGK